MGLVKRSMYRAERPAARKKGVLGHDQAPVACPDASPKEIAMALASLCGAARFKVGRGGEYDRLKDVYTVVGSGGGKAQDIKIEGVAVAAVIGYLRDLNGTPQFDPQRLTKALSEPAR